MWIFLQANRISEISPSTFSAPMVKWVVIYLDYNEQITSIPPGAFNFPLATFMSIGMSRNQITRIPCGVFNYPLGNGELYLFLESNKITTIPSCAFNFPSKYFVRIHLGNNSITTISPGAFHFPSASQVYLRLEDNFISSFPSNIFAQGKHKFFNIFFFTIWHLQTGDGIKFYTLFIVYSLKFILRMFVK